ncbi:MAG: hypothetical protein COW00_11295 [Bdellovibrio sp. CG12_big_fil_rev_8_21_14_0_65_39_13]|nr:MAG: hypothetical protein COW78_16650 [Bdellovibrio sp. CG22_combo_CG10-13_8_21_14_all_39_27]PIQ59306.1 MAG: hypothetical protein COW00_11295 [Bdellovibrio sp. CG12_big_fil_rev_8_21_14_0_65_39_13]PIR32317.1 MAG: hypothetical protein COV37_20585 [Bdellovibrio sp. CG11_big_fil_rev_8_21_14_0_20_39_38]
MMLLGCSFLLLSFILFIASSKALLSPLKRTDIRSGQLLLEAFSTPLNFRPEYQYKNFTKNWGQLLEWQRKLGAGIKSPMQELRKQLIQDLRIERKKTKLLSSTLFQALGISFMTLSFSFTLISLNLIDLSIGEFLILILWQVIGLYLLRHSSHFLQEKLFNESDIFRQTLVQLLIFSSAGLPASQILQQLPWSKLRKCKSTEIVQKINSLETQFELWKKQGIELKLWLQEQFEESLFFTQFQLEKFEESLGLLSFLTLVLFFLSTFLFMVFQMVVQMI